MNAPTSKKKRARNTVSMKDPGLFGQGRAPQPVKPEDIDLDAIARTVAFSDWYEAVYETSPEAKARRSNGG